MKRICMEIRLRKLAMTVRYQVYFRCFPKKRIKVIPKTGQYHQEVTKMIIPKKDSTDFARL